MDVLRGVREITVHLHNQIGSVSERPPEAIYIGATQSALARPVQHVHAARELGRQPIGDAAGAIGRLVVHVQHAQEGEIEAEQGITHRPDVVGLVVGGDHNGQLHHPSNAAHIRPGYT